MNASRRPHAPAPLLCPQCKGHLDLHTEVIEYASGAFSNHKRLCHTLRESFVACSRCEYAETLHTLLYPAS